MFSFGRHATVHVTASVLALAAATLPYAGSAQPHFEPVDDAIRRLVAEIEAEQLENGPLSEALIDPLTALTLLYQEGGDHQLALAASERALHVVRATSGLHSFDQAPLLRHAIRAEEERGNLETAWSLEQGLLALTRRHPDDLRTIPVLTEIGDRRMALLEQYMTGAIPPQIHIGCYYRPAYLEEGSCNSGSRSVAVQGILDDAWRSYSAAIDVYLRHELYANDDLLALEMDLLRSSYIYGNYGLGREILRRLSAYDIANSEPWPSRLDALLRLADWELLFGQTARAYKAYQRAYEFFEQQGASRASIDRRFSPEQPIVLPTFLPSPLSSEPAGAIGHIDVAFDVTLHGNPGRVEILETTTGAPREARKRLVQLISRSRFRPSVVGGELPRKSRMALRFHLSEQKKLLRGPSEEAQIRYRHIRNYRLGAGGGGSGLARRLPLRAEDLLVGGE